MKVLNNHLAYLLIGTSSLLGGAHIAMAQQLELGTSYGMDELGHGSQAYGVSADGKVVVGSLTGLGILTAPQKWDSENASRTTLTPLNVQLSAHATAVSANGSVFWGLSKMSLVAALWHG